MLKVYVGARYTRKVEARRFAEMLMENGFAVTATWFKEPESPTIQLDEVSDATLIEYAKRDVAEIDAADVLILMSDPPREAHPRGGKHWETGYAYGKGKPVVVFGPVENIFHMLPDVLQVDTFAGLTYHLRELRHKLRPAVYAVLPVSQSAHPMSGGSVIGYGLHPSGSSEVRVTDPLTGGAKGSKPCRVDLIPPDPLWQLGLVYGMGAEKYEPYNWLRGYKWSLSIAALFRHLILYIRGEYMDEESKLAHLAHVMWHCATLMEFHRLKKGTDDRQITIEKGAK